MRQYVIAIGLALAVFVGLTYGIDRFLDAENGRNWAAAIQASSTVVLVAITALYAVYTRQLVKAQQIDTRRRDEVPVAQRLLARVGTLDVDSLMLHLSRSFPLDQNVPADPKVVEVLQAPWLEGLRADISSLTPVLPQALSEVGQSYLAACVGASRQTRLLSTSIRDELDRCKTDNRPFEWARARQQFSNLREALPEGERSEWEECIRGDGVGKLREQHVAIIPAIRVYLGETGA
jgi:hypothetical protein